MKRTWATAVLLLALVAETGRQAGATSNGRTTFLQAAQQIRSLDPSLAPVRIKIIGNGTHPSGCGPIEQGDLVASYCPNDRMVYVSESTINRVNQSFGSGGLRYLIAHELAHGRQHSVTGYASNLVWSSVLDELQADCVAGAWLRRAYGYSADSQASLPIQRFAYSIGDAGFYTRDWHGNPRLRLAALNRGLRKGDPASCLSSSRFNYASLLEQGQAWIRLLRQLQQR